MASPTGTRPARAGVSCCGGGGGWGGCRGGGGACAGGCELLWRVSKSVTLPVVTELVDGSYLSVVFRRGIWHGARPRLLEAARRGEDLDPAEAVVVRVIEYKLPSRTGPLTVTAATTPMPAHPAGSVAAA